MPKTYSEAGVDIDKEGVGINAIVKELKYRRDGIGGLLTEFGHYTGLVDFGDWALSLCTDGVGTKLLVASALKKWDTVGIDCMALNVNDMICIGAEPIAFVDYFAIERYDEEMAKQIGIGLNDGARQANVTIIGGEFSTIPEIVRGFDLAGACLGIVKKKDIITGDDIKPGDAIIGLRSSGIHSNGLTLARKVFESSGMSFSEKLPNSNETVGMALLTPMRIYVREVLDIIKDFNIKGMAHITGGGLRNLIRLKRDVEFRISSPMEPHDIFRAIQELGEIEKKEMYQTFNMGMGFCVIANENEADEITKNLKSNVEAKVVGTVEEGKGATCPSLDLSYEKYSGCLRGETRPSTQCENSRSIGTGDSRRCAPHNAHCRCRAIGWRILPGTFQHRKHIDCIRIAQGQG
jgi:phosphoribosylformylglycinamidine cyclo-ligase